MPEAAGWRRSALARAGAAFLAASLWVKGADAADLTVVEPEPATCGGAGDLAFRAERALGQPLAPAAGPSFVVTITRNQRGVSAIIEVADAPEGAALRTFTAPDCDELFDTVALSVALALGATDRDARGATEGAASDTMSVAPATIPPTSTPPDVPAPESGPGAVESSGWAPSFGASASVLGDTGSLPKPSLGLGVGVGLEWRAFQIRAHGLLLPARETRVETIEPGSPGAELGLVAGGLLACVPVAVSSSEIELGACAGWELGRLSGRGTRIDISHEAGTLWSAARIEFGARWASPVASLGLELIVGAAAPLTRDEFILKDIGSVYQPQSMVGRASLGLSWAAPRARAY